MQSPRYKRYRLWKAIVKGGGRMDEKKNEKKHYIVPKGPDLGGSILVDPNGSYTGLPLFSTEEPVQDADDL